MKQLSDLAGISVRTLHYYDELGLLKPSQVRANGYRYYDEAALLRLQQILFYREIGLELTLIKEILDRPDFDLLAALQSHRSVLQEKIKRLEKLVSTVDSTIMYLAGEVAMNKKRLFEAFSDEKQKEYERSVRLQYGPETVNESIRRWNGYTKAEKEKIGEEGNQIYGDFLTAIEAGASAQSAEVQAIVQRWHSHIQYFYEPTLEILRGLGELYTSHPDFIATFQKIHPQLPDYLQAAIAVYIDELEYAEIKRLLAEDEGKGGTG